ncbi:MAG TPA: heavy metal translocating P-type ATPase [Candidatus Saccharimonadales bacterium]|nr:heavy metal translocating P-type ATPase [Candidatus Saccharimonadales bacterium]
MWRDIRVGRYGIDILALTAIITSVVLKQYWAAIVIVIMLTGGEALEDYAEHRAKTELSALLERAPTQAHILRGRKTLDVSAQDVHKGDKLLIKTGEVVPVDATILDGSASFDESSLTGESLPQTKAKGDQILSGSISLDGSVTVRATHSAADSQYEQIIKLVRSASASQAPFVRLADRYSIPFTVMAYAIAGAAWIVSGHAIRFLDVIVVATPCPLLLAAPIALISGMSRASKYGIIVKTGAALEKLAETQTIAFDKTGTLTHGNITVDNVSAFHAYKQREVLAYAASLEQTSSHVLAAAVVDAANQKKLRIIKAKHVHEEPGHGLRARVQSNDVLVGRLSLMKQHDITLPRELKTATIAQTAAFVAVDGKLAGVITFRDEPRHEAKTTLGQLKKLGIKSLLMITGDSKSAAQKIAKHLGITDVQAEALPGDKLRAIEAIENKPVAFVGDGVNDAPVLTAADVGIALGARGSTAASESADMVIMLDDISLVTTAVAIAKHTFKIAKQSILIGIALSLVLMLIFSTGILSPLAGALLQEVVDVFVIFNALRAHSAGKA